MCAHWVHTWQKFTSLALSAATLSEHLDPYCLPAVRRLWADLKLGASDRAPYASVVAHPHGAAMLASARAYAPVDVYKLRDAIAATAGRGLDL